MNNPLLEEQIRESFLNSSMMKIHLIGLAAISFMIFLFYPTQPLSYFLARSVEPEMFNIAVYTIFAFMAYLSVKTSIFNIHEAAIIGLKEWSDFGKLPGYRYLRGLLAYGLFYTAFLNLLFLPCLLVSASVSGIAPANFLAILAVLYLFTMDIYLAGTLLFVLFGKPYWFLTLILWFSLVVTVLIIPLMLSAKLPFLLFIELQKSTNVSSDIRLPIAIFLIAAFLLIFSARLAIFQFDRSRDGR